MEKVKCVDVDYDCTQGLVYGKVYDVEQRYKSSNGIEFVKVKGLLTHFFATRFEQVS